MACIRLSDREVWTVAAWVFDFVGRSCATVLGREHEFSLAFDSSVLDGSRWLDLRSIKASVRSDFETIIQSIVTEAAGAAGPLGFHNVDPDFQAGLLDRVKELQELLCVSLKKE